MTKTFADLRRVSMLAGCGILLMAVSACVLPASAAGPSNAAPQASASAQSTSEFKPLKAMPASFALPLYTKNVKKTSFSQKTAPPYPGLCAFVMTTDDVATVSEFYKSYLAKNGWKTKTQKKETTSQSGPFQDQAFSVSKGAVTGTVHVTGPKDGKTSIINLFQYSKKS